MLTVILYIAYIFIAIFCFCALMSIWSNVGGIYKILKDIRTIEIARDTRAGFAPTDKKGRIIKGTK